MSALRVCLFGGFRLSHDGWTREMKVTRAVQCLLAYLLVHRHRIHPREVLAGVFWGDHNEERARSCLSTALWRLRQALEPENIPKGSYLVTTSTGEVGFNLESDYWLDMAVFEERVSQLSARPIQAMEADDASQIENALQLYEGDLLEGFYDDWALSERERLRSLYLKTLAYLMRYYGYHGAHERAIACGRQLLNHDPLREGIHREVMRFYLESGQRAMAIQQYKTCCHVLEEELGIPPMEETQALYSEITKTRGHQAAQSTLRQARGSGSSREPPGLEEAFRNLKVGMQQLEKSGEQLQRAIRLLERIIKC